MPERLRRVASLIGLGLALTLLVAACGSSATAAPSAGGSGGASLDGRWVLTNYTSPGGTEVTVPAAVLPDITFNGTSVNGNAGCNSFNAIAVINGPAIHFDQVTTTKKACPDPMATVEAAYMQALNLATTVGVNGDTLVLSGQGGQPKLTFVRASA